MSNRTYISVILPLRLEWQPVYWTREAVQVGSRVKVALSGREYIGVVLEVGVAPTLSPSKIHEIVSVEQGLVSQEQLELWQQIASYYLCTLGEVYKAIPSTTETAKTTAQKREKAETRQKEGGEASKKGNEEGGKIGRPTLLLGYNRLEKYIELARKTIEAGQNVLMLVPEIVLTKVLEKRLRTEFGEELAVYHSGQTPAQRRKIFEKIFHNQYFLLGTRSAVLLPHQNLGLIIVDEEQDSSYKQSSPAPHYNARDVAIMLAHGRCRVVLGTTTASLESLYNCRIGKYEMALIQEPELRAESLRENTIEIVDIIAERRKRGMVGTFSRKLIEQIQRRLQKKEQVMILHWLKKEELEAEAVALFPEARVARLDAEVLQSKSRAKEVIKKFEAGEIDILIGTQIVTRWFNVETLSLVALIQSDALLGLPDFRADEKALQVLAQFRGRCAREGRPCTFLIQTARPKHPVYQSLARRDFRIVDDLLKEREEFHYPPFTRIVDIVVRHAESAKAENMAKKVALELQDFTLDGPWNPVVPKDSALSCQIIRVTLKKEKELASKKHILARRIAVFAQKEGMEGNIVIDVDPV